MEFKNTIEVLHSQAREIVDITSKLEQQDDIPFIEIDLLLEKLRNIYDLTTDLRSALQTDRSPELKKQAIRQENHTVKQDDNEAEPKEKLLKPTKENIREKIEEDLATEAREKEKLKNKSKLVSDRFQTSDPTLNDEISEKSKKEDISSQYKTKPIGSINSALGLNEKFELINELFNGNKEKFERTMEVLDTAGSFVEAYNYLEGNFEWDMDDVYVQRILELIRRKLIVRRNEQ